MADICPKCGLSSELCVCETIAREQQKIEVKVEKRKFGKNYTVVSGLSKEVNLEDILKKLKAKFACGGTQKSGRIELQGDHRSRIRKVLGELGFPEETIEIKAR